MNASFYTLISSLLNTYNKEQIFLRTSQSLGHSYKEIDSIPQILQNEQYNEIKQDVDFIEIITYFFGLLGNQSPLPNYILDKFSKNQDDGVGFSLFFDFFNNHFLWLLYESATLRSYSRSFKSTLDDRISQILFNLLGLQDKNLAKEYFPFAPLILSLRRPKHYIEKVLQHNLKLTSKIEIIENIPQQIPITHSQQNILGKKNNILGINIVLGNITLSYENKILILISDIPYYESLLFLPKQIKYNKLKDNITFLTNNTLSADVKLHIKYHKKMHFIFGDKTSARLGFGILGDIEFMKNKETHYIWYIHLCE